MKKKSNIHKLTFCGEFIREIEFDKKEECYLLNATRFYLGKQLVGLEPYHGSFFAYKGEIIQLLGGNKDQEYHFKVLTTPIPKVKKEECNHGTLKKCVKLGEKEVKFPDVDYPYKAIEFYVCDKCNKEFIFNSKIT